MNCSLRTLVLLVLCVFALFTVTSCKRKSKKSKDPKPPSWKEQSKPAQKESIQSHKHGKRLRLACPVLGHPKPSLEWFKDGEKIPTGARSSKRIKAKKHTLTIEVLEKSDQGNYTCVARNDHGQIDWTYMVNVIVKVWPLDVIGPRNRTVHVGQSSVFKCKVLNDETAKIQWLKKRAMITNNKTKPGLESTKYIDNEENHETYVLQQVSMADAGQYTCLVSNPFGIKYIDAWLNVLPDPPGDGYGGTTYDSVNYTNVNMGKSSRPAFTVHLRTVYIITGSVAGAVLLISMVVIVVTMLCRKDSSGAYKSTSV